LEGLDHREKRAAGKVRGRRSIAFRVTKSHACNARLQLTCKGGR
jgi:hypothetical protein